MSENEGRGREGREWERREKENIHWLDAGLTSSSAMVPSPSTVLTASWPHAASMAGPGRRAGGQVMLPWADTEVAASAAPARNDAVLMFAFLSLFTGYQKRARYFLGFGKRRKEKQTSGRHCKTKRRGGKET